jgi:hypothetical protein
VGAVALNQNLESWVRTLLFKKTGNPVKAIKFPYALLKLKRPFLELLLHEGMFLFHGLEFPHPVSKCFQLTKGLFGFVSVLHSYLGLKNWTNHTTVQTILRPDKLSGK